MLAEKFEEVEEVNVKDFSIDSLLDGCRIDRIAFKQDGALHIRLEGNERSYEHMLEKLKNLDLLKNDIEINDNFYLITTKISLYITFKIE